MARISIFVEGATELIIVRNLILEKYNWQVNVNCYKIIKDENIIPTKLDNQCLSSENFYNIFECGNDDRVLSAMLNRASKLLEKNDCIVGLRDMHSNLYCNLSNKVDNFVIEKMYTTSMEEINRRGFTNDKIKLCFSIMKIEAWYLGMPWVLEKINRILTIEEIKKIGLDLEKNNPETEYFNPQNVLEKVLSIAQMDYHKHHDEIEKFSRNYTYEDYIKLYESSACGSFNAFYNSIFNT